jgi:hypothetical protein
MNPLTKKAIRFLLAAFACALARASDVTSFDVVKGRAYSQSDSGPSILQTNNPFFFNAGVDTRNSPNTLNSATITLPGGGTLSLTNFQNDGASFGQSFATQPALDAAFGNGNHVFAINTIHDGTHTGLVLNLSGDIYPNPPHISNLFDGQRINPHADFILKWDGFTNSTANDFLWLTVKYGNSTIFKTRVNPADAGALSGTNTSLVISSNTLASGRSYSATLMFVKLPVRDTNSYPGALGFAAYAAGTSFTIIAPPRIDFALPYTNSQFRLRVTGAAGSNYMIQVATNLVSTNVSWISLFTSNSTSGTFEFVDKQATNPARLYRAVSQ